MARISDKDAEKLAERLIDDEWKKKAALPRPTPKESRVMKEVRDTDLEGDN